MSAEGREMFDEGSGDGEGLCPRSMSIMLKASSVFLAIYSPLWLDFQVPVTPRLRSGRGSILLARMTPSPASPRHRTSLGAQ